MNSISDKIQQHKAGLNINFRLKQHTVYFTELLVETLFDQNANVESNLDLLKSEFEQLANLACWNPKRPCCDLWEDYVNNLPNLLALIKKDAEAIMEGDPAATCLNEIYLAYPGFFAIALYRLAHPLYVLGLPLVPRLMTEYAHQKTGVDIHPGATIGQSFFIDHATGVVIGETTIIHDHVKLYQGVTLGALVVDKNLKNTKRHPTICSGVTIYANATILGGETVIGANSTIGGNAWVTNSVPAHSKVYHKPEILIKSSLDV